MTIICTTILHMMPNRVNLISNLSNLRRERFLQTFIQAVHVPAYVYFRIILAADDGPDEMTSFPAGLQY